MPPAGLEPAPRGLKGRRSNQLSYRGRSRRFGSASRFPTALPFKGRASGRVGVGSTYPPGWYTGPPAFTVLTEPRGFSTRTQIAVTVIVELAPNHEYE
jgi:hypothetical protein